MQMSASGDAQPSSDMVSSRMLGSPRLSPGHAQHIPGAVENGAACCMHASAFGSMQPSSAPDQS